jgi:type IV pilus assembly protein PilM
MALSFLKKFFPMPGILTPRAVGFDVSDQSIKFAELVETRHGLDVRRHGAISIPPGVILSGKIQDAVRLTDILHNFQRTERVSRVRVSLPEEQVYLFEIRVPRVSAKTIPGTIELSLEEHIPLKASEVVFDYSLIRETETSFDLQVAALPVAVAESYVSVFHNAGLEPISLELEAQAVARAVTTRGTAATVLVIDFGETRTGISIVESGLVRFTTTLEIGGYAITKTIEKMCNCSFAEAERMKRTIGLSRKPEHQELFSTLLQSIAVLRDEVNKHYIYWHTHKDELGGDHKKIERLLLVGGNANMPGLEDYLSASLKTKVEPANPWVNITNPNERIPSIESADALSYATALGLALGVDSHD